MECDFCDSFFDISNVEHVCGRAVCYLGASKKSAEVYCVSPEQEDACNFPRESEPSGSETLVPNPGKYYIEKVLKYCVDLYLRVD